jgi:hypothetical protein
MLTARKRNSADGKLMESFDLILIVLFVVVAGLFWLFVWWNRG